MRIRCLNRGNSTCGRGLIGSGAQWVTCHIHGPLWHSWSRLEHSRLACAHQALFFIRNPAIIFCSNYKVANQKTLPIAVLPDFARRPGGFCPLHSQSIESVDRFDPPALNEPTRHALPDRKHPIQLPASQSIFPSSTRLGLLPVLPPPADSQRPRVERSESERSTHRHEPTSRPSHPTTAPETLDRVRNHRIRQQRAHWHSTKRTKRSPKMAPSE